MPRIVDHSDRRRKICDALLEVIAEVGVAGATIRKVAQRSGWSTGVIGHYFGNRDALLLGGLRRAGELLAEQQARILASLRGRVALEQILEAGLPIDRYGVALNRIFLFFYVESMHDQDLQVEIENYLSLWRRAVEKAVRLTQETGDLPPDLDPHQVAYDLIALVDGLCIHALLWGRAQGRLLDHSPVRFWISRLAAAPAETPSGGQVLLNVKQVSG